MCLTQGVLELVRQVKLPQGYKLSCVMTVSLHWACSRLLFFFFCPSRFVLWVMYETSDVVSTWATNITV